MDVSPVNDEQLALLDGSMVNDSEDDCPKFELFKEQLDVVMKLMEVLKQKIIDIALTTDDLTIMEKELGEMTEREKQLPPNEMKSHHVPYRALSLKMIQESYRICNWLVQKQCSETDNLFSPDLFIDKILEACSDKEDPLDHLNTISDGVFKNTDYFCLHFVGSSKPVSEEVVEELVKAKKELQSKSQKRQLVVDQIVPDEVDNAIVHNEVDFTLVKVQNCLKRAIKKNNGNPIPFFKFVIDPLSMTYTVENLFYLSSLIKDGCVKIQNDDDNLDSATLTIFKNRKNDNEETLKNGNTNKDKTSFLFSINHELWMHYVKKYKVTERMIDQE